jgi:hypothetical protein
MRFLAVVADVAMGVFVGIFLFAVLTRFWPSTFNAVVGTLVVAGSILIVLFRPPNGSFAPRRDRTP